MTGFMNCFKKHHLAVLLQGDREAGRVARWLPDSKKGAAVQSSLVLWPPGLLQGNGCQASPMKMFGTASPKVPRDGEKWGQSVTCTFTTWPYLLQANSKWCSGFGFCTESQIGHLWFLASTLDLLEHQESLFVQCECYPSAVPEVSVAECARTLADKRCQHSTCAILIWWSTTAPWIRWRPPLCRGKGH